MRRAMRNARLIGKQDPYLYELTGFVAELMRPAYPEMMDSIQRVARVVKDEEHRYATTFVVAEKVFNDEISKLSGTTVPGAVSFKLYDTYGLALDEQDDIARERGVSIDRAGFEAEMRHQRERARASWKGGEKGAVAPAYRKLLEHGRTKFLGYNALDAVSTVTAILVDQQPVDDLAAGAQAELVLDQTPFYAETGGQVGDRGTLLDAHTGMAVATVEDTYPAVPGLTVHRIRAIAPVHTGDELQAEVAAPERWSTMRNHTATHLLHAALRQVLGAHVKQHGSVVEPPRLRFDFDHYVAMDDAEIEEVERLVNREILRNTQVTTNVMPLDQAISTGAMALFGEKYGEEVRVVSIPDFSKELCGGTHVTRTGDIGVFKITSESSISAGVRRIEAITGEFAARQYRESTEALHRMAGMLRVAEPELVSHVERLIEEKRLHERQIEQLKTKLAQSAARDLESRAKEKNGVRYLIAQVDDMDRQQMRALADTLRNILKSAIVVLASTENGSVSIVSGVTKDLTQRFQAGKLVGVVAQAVGGKGGGRPDMAEGGGKEPAALPQALAALTAEVENKL
jgi:alanyl-tRNA synthetase